MLKLAKAELAQKSKSIDSAAVQIVDAVESGAVMPDTGSTRS